MQANYVIAGYIKPNILVSLLGSDYVINMLLLFSILSGARVKVIASIAHFLVVERSYHFKYTVTGFAANKLLI